MSVGFLLSLDWLKHISKLKDEEDKESGDREEDSGVAGKRVISFHGDMRFQFDSGGSQVSDDMMLGWVSQLLLPVEKISMHVVTTGQKEISSDHNIIPQYVYT